MRLMRSRGLQENDARDTTQQVLLRSSVGDRTVSVGWRRGIVSPLAICIARNVVVTFLSKQSRQPMLIEHWNALNNWSLLWQPGEEMKCFQQEFDQQILAWAMEQVRSEFRVYFSDDLWFTELFEVVVGIGD